MIIYISGPMRGKPELNRKAFYDANSRIRNAGHTPINPFDLVVDPSEQDISRLMKADIDALFSCDAIAVLPGWKNSEGAVAEVALSCVILLPALDGLTLHDVTWDIRKWYRTIRGTEDA